MLKVGNLLQFHTGPMSLFRLYCRPGGRGGEGTVNKNGGNEQSKQHQPPYDHWHEL